MTHDQVSALVKLQSAQREWLLAHNWTPELGDDGKETGHWLPPHGYPRRYDDRYGEPKVYRDLWHAVNSQRLRLSGVHNLAHIIAKYMATGLQVPLRECEVPWHLTWADAK
jgi:hypothetical protein